ncbi:hypothetical protein ABW21_db0209811 [Orbilia brochopaga]|nr:hypothetical protein ABW21_db0209811 [Drechslerella brochopaga]
MFTAFLFLALMEGILSLPIPRPIKLLGLADTGPLYAPAAPKPTGPPGSDAGYISSSTNAQAVDDKPELQPDGRMPIGYVENNPPVGVANPPVIVHPATAVKTAVAAPPIAVATIYVYQWSKSSLIGSKGLESFCFQT